MPGRHSLAGEARGLTGARHRVVAGCRGRDLCGSRLRVRSAEVRSEPAQQQNDEHNDQDEYDGSDAYIHG
jgi:hypothetical protein